MSDSKTYLDRLQKMVNYRRLDESGDAATLHPYVSQTSLPGVSGMPNRQTNNMGDNALMDDGKQEELDEDSTPRFTDAMLPQLKQILNAVGINDEAIIAHRVSLKHSGSVKVARALTGKTMSEEDAHDFVTNAIFKLGQSLINTEPQEASVAEDEFAGEVNDFDSDSGDGDEEELDEFYSTPAAERFSYTTDAMGNVSIQDAETGNSVYLSGSDAVELLGALEMHGGTPEKEQAVLAQYQHVMESPLGGFAGELAGLLKESESQETLADLAPELLNELKSVAQWLETGDVDSSFLDPIKSLIARGDKAVPSENSDLLQIAEMALEYIDALPKDIQLPAMPGFDRDWADSVIDNAKKGM